MKKKKKFRKAYGLNSENLVDFPKKVSNVKISRILYGNARGCSYCFPHGFETSNASVLKNTRNWKFNRKTQWKID